MITHTVVCHHSKKKKWGPSQHPRGLGAAMVNQSWHCASCPGTAVSCTSPERHCPSYVWTPTPPLSETRPTWKPQNTAPSKTHHFDKYSKIKWSSDKKGQQAKASNHGRYLGERRIQNGREGQVDVVRETASVMWGVNFVPAEQSPNILAPRL